MSAEEIPDEDFDAVNAEGLDDDTADEASPAASVEYSTEDEDDDVRFLGYPSGVRLLLRSLMSIHVCKCHARCCSNFTALARGDLVHFQRPIATYRQGWQQRHLMLSWAKSLRR